MSANNNGTIGTENTGDSLCKFVGAPEDIHGEWRSVPGFPSEHVMVSSKGWVRVRSRGKVKYEGIRPLDKPTRGCKTATGCYAVYIEHSMLLVHRLVAFAFKGKCPGKGFTVDHIDRDSTNNDESNLRWATKKQQRANQEKMARPRTAQVVVLTDKDGIDTEYLSQHDAALAIGCFQGSVSQAIRTGCRCRGYTASVRMTEQQDDIVVDGTIEEWKVSHICPRLRVSTMGRIQRMLNRGGSWGPKITPQPTKNKGGYCFVAVDEQRLVVHRIILETFGGINNNPALTADHINRIRHDNRIGNLRWATASQQGLNQGRNAG